MSLKLKRGTKDKIESALSDAMAQLEVEDSTSDDLKKKELALKRVVTKAVSIFSLCSPHWMDASPVNERFLRLFLGCHPASFPFKCQRFR
jgi:hypothetical protein